MRIKEEEPLLDELPDYEEDDDDLVPARNEEDDDLKAKTEPEIPKFPNDQELTELRNKLAKQQEDLEKAQKEVATERLERERAQYHTVKAHIEKLQLEDRALRTSIRNLELEADEAKANGDMGKYRILKSEIDETTDKRTYINGEITKYSPALNNVPQEKAVVKEVPKAEALPQAQTMAEIRLNDWMEANKVWYDNPAHADKRAKALELCKKLSSQGYDAGSALFWKHIDDKLSEGEQKQRGRSQPVMRGATMDAEPAKGRKKNDAEALQLTNQILSQMGFTARDREDPKFKQKSASVARTVARRLAEQRARG